MRETYDKRRVFDANAVLPHGASGWTLVRHLDNASYSSELTPEDRPKAAADYAAVEVEAAQLRTRATAVLALTALGRIAHDYEKLSDLRVRYHCARMDDMWPLRMAE